MSVSALGRLKILKYHIFTYNAQCVSSKRHQVKICASIYTKLVSMGVQYYSDKLELTRTI